METQGLSQTIAEEQIDYQSGDHERYAHYVNKNKIVESAVMGNAVEALCGKIWVPSRDPQKFPVCPSCQEIYEALKKD
jgi:hypothetical protein